VTVTTPNGTSATSAADSYLYVAAPTVTALSPSSGSTGGGTVVTITGTNLTGASAVRFGTAAATGFTVVSATQVTATAPAGAAGAVDVTVTTPGGTSATGAADRYTYLALPTVTALSPVTGPVTGGTSVIITGTNLTGATGVKFGLASAIFTVDSATQVTATSPAGSAGAVDVTVTTPSGTSATSAADQFTYGNGPTVGAVSPTSGPTGGGTTVTITGANLTGATAVKFGTAAAASFTVASATTITAVTPAETSGTVDVTVTTPVGTSAANAGDRFTFGGLPAVTALSPSSGPTTGGAAVTISGANFTGATAVKFGNTAATNVVVVGASQITAAAPASSAGIVDVTVTTPIGTSATSAADAYTYTAAPSVTALSPALGPTSGGTSVTITGTNLTGATAVKFGTAAAGFTVVSAMQITATAPPGAPGTVDVTVTTPNGTSAASAADRFTYTALPIVTALSPASGGTAGGTVVTITGANLTGATAVRFGALAAAGFTVGSATEITATAPAGAASTVDVIVTTPNGASATSAADRFTYTTGTAGQVYSYQSTLGTTGAAQADNAHFSSPSAGAVDPAGNHLFVADAGNHRVQVLDTGSLAVVATIGAPGVAGSDNAHLDGPMGVGFDPMTGHVLVADTGNHRVQIFDAGSFAYLATLGVAGTAGTDNAHFDAPASVHLNPATRELYIADTGNHRVQVFGADALGYIATIGVSGVAGADTTHLDEPRDAELDPSSNQIMVADSGNARLQLFDAGTLAYTGTLGGLGLGGQDNDYLGTPVTAAFDPASNLVLVADAGTDDRVQVFDAMTYGYVLTLGTTGSSGPGNSQFAGPSGIAADPAHARLFVGDRQNDRVEVYSIALPVAFASVLPGSRSVQLGNPATIFASLINAGSTALQGCQIALPVAAPAGLTLSYQTTNPATNALTGTPNTPATIAGGDGVQSFLVSLQGTNAFTAAALPLDFDCVGVAPAPVTTGVDTVDLTLSVTPVADIIALAATPSHDGIVTVPVGGNAAFAVASTNAGAASLIIASVDTGSAILPLTATLCQSNPATGQCLATPAASVPLSFGTGAAPTFSVFLGASAPIALDPAAARIFMRFRDADGRLHGSTSVAVRAD
jgi:YVTN family beta-propeller protein